MIAVGEPVETGLVASLARPGENATGVCSLSYGLEGKRLELLREVLPSICVLECGQPDPSHPGAGDAGRRRSVGDEDVVPWRTQSGRDRGSIRGDRAGASRRPL